MAKLYYVFSLFSVLWVSPAPGQTLLATHGLATHGAVSLRGLSAPSFGVLWVSGSSGTVGRSSDGGVHWTWISVPGYAHTDFRDVEGFDSLTALIMGIDTPAVILRTTDGGQSWKRVFYDASPGMFLDAMSFAGAMGYVVGDPVNGHFFIAGTRDAGKTWQESPGPKADSGEGCFASSGSNILVAPGVFAPFIFVSGGPISRMFLNQKVYKIPMSQGSASTGANSIATDSHRWIVVGGDFAHDTITTGNCAITEDGGAHWSIPHTPPHGYRSCVIHLWDSTWLCCGTSGIDVSYDMGENWTLISRQSFHVAAYPGSGRTVYLAGSRGRVAKLAL